MAVRPRHRKNGKIYLFATFVVLAVLWAIYWYGAQQIAAAALDRMTAAAVARGFSLECLDEKSGGFPLNINLSCSRASLAGEADRSLIVVDGFSVTSPLYRPGWIRSAATGPLTFDSPARGISLTANWQNAETEIGAGLGGLTDISTMVEGLRLRLQPGVHLVPFDTLSLSAADISIAPGSGGSYRISAVLGAIAAATDGSRQLPEIDLETELAALDFGNSLGLDPRKALRDWLARGETLQIDKLKIVADAVSTSLSGALDIAPGGKLSGDLKVTIQGLEMLPDLVETFRPGSREQVAKIATAIAAFSKPVATPDGISREMTLLIRDNIVSIGIIPIGVIPTISF